ncbi:acyclic terpene utilization AtuA family protein [Amycolatopsis sp. A133]|uniref:acyclic terpene utilization AtuA family protein n=1 Tax=Amycolatopsis sp. A133 TaxID=3064472 RepID=UPI0027F8DFB4|nr:acyclic terpene utilization AtuA family protein [Amycolatopsis sp. A133]MDQ7807362.1 acyclic terpene utilization AtuA family protein [Amycolatopsis sp. A133]
MPARRPVRIASFSGGMGDKFAAFRQAVHGEPVDVLVGDSMTEFVESMVVARFLDEPEKHRRFFSPLFLQQLLPELEALAEKKLKVVTNAGAHAPCAMAGKIRQAVAERGLRLNVACVTGDDLLEEARRLIADGQLGHVETGDPIGKSPKQLLAADAYLGGWGIKTALDHGADIVVTGRVADASLVSGAAAWWHEWARDQLDEIAGAVAAGHIIECGAQATGGNFSGFTTVPDNVLPGFPIAEIAGNGDSVITKRADEGGAVTVDTVTAQLVYEIQGPRYLNPDVTWHTDSVTVSPDGPDRVRVTGAKGSAPSETTRVGVNFQRGYRGSMWYFLTGLQIDEKVRVLTRQAEIAARDNHVDLRLFPCGRPADDPADQWQATVPVKVHVAGPAAKNIEDFLAQLNSYWLNSLPGLYIDITQMLVNPPQPRIDYWPGAVRQDSLRHQVRLADGRVLDIAPPPGVQPFGGQPCGTATSPPAGPSSWGPTARRPLGEVVHARVGDKAGNADLGLWVSEDVAYPWLVSFLTADRLTELLPVPAEVAVERHELPNLRALCFVLRGYLAPSSSSGLSLDQLGKGLGEFLRARHADIPLSLLPSRLRITPERTAVSGPA